MIILEWDVHYLIFSAHNTAEESWNVEDGKLLTHWL